MSADVAVSACMRVSAATSTGAMRSSARASRLAIAVTRALPGRESARCAGCSGS